MSDPSTRRRIEPRRSRCGCRGWRSEEVTVSFDHHQPVCLSGDPYCPCVDGDACHYVAYGTSPASTPPTRNQIDRIVDGAQAVAASSPWHATEAHRVFRHRRDGLAAGRKHAPYGERCRDPNACTGKGSCPLDPTCGD